MGRHGLKASKSSPNVRKCRKCRFASFCHFCHFYSESREDRNDHLLSLLLEGPVKRLGKRPEYKGVLRRAVITDVVPRVRTRAVQTGYSLRARTLCVGFFTPIDLYILDSRLLYLSRKYIIPSGTVGPGAGNRPERPPGHNGRCVYQVGH